ncbi:MAG TPA: oligopeptide/dipeptide ABC transporter ATP-binding protein [Chitinispirillaceae bacterium]|nr:oligopeptide/dipeptide ABC transporter ATP-binding protein [Chitinispirillaceae bacterium]
MNNNETVVDVKNLKVHFPVYQGIFGNVINSVKAVDDVSFSIKRGEIFSLVGESGCGKTTVAHSILGLIHKTSGSIKLSVGKWKESSIEWENLSNSEKRELRKQIQVVFQDPYSSLNPRMNIQRILEEPFIIHKICTKQERTKRIIKLLNNVGLSTEYLNRYPHEFSGGQRQRIGIARALATEPELIIADEPVSALDVSIQAQIINLLQDLRSSFNQTLLFISHDLAVVRHIADRLAVMYLGKIVESGTETQIFDSPRHPYTSLLLQSIPVPGKGRCNRNITVSEDKNKVAIERGCSFFGRCPLRTDNCLDHIPPLQDIGDGHFVSCYNVQK